VRVLAFGTYDAALHPRVAVLLEGLRDHGHTVVELNEPLALSTAQRVATLQQPWRLPVLGWQIARSWARLVASSRVGSRPDLVVVGFLGHFDVVLARALFRGVPIVLDLLVSAEETARDRGSTSRPVLGALRWLDRLAVRCADVVVVDTEEHLALVGAHRRRDTVVVPVGAPDAWFTASRDDTSSALPPSAATSTAMPIATSAATPTATPTATPHGPLRVVFFGTFTPLQGAPVIGRAISLLADEPIDFTVIGRGQDYDATVAAAGSSRRVTWVPWVPAAELPSVVAGHDVCLGIFGVGPKARSVVPNKVFQGMAAGLAVVTSDTPPQRRALDGAVDLVPPGDAHALAAALLELAADPGLLETSRARASARARSQMSPRAVTTSLTQRLGVRSIRPPIG